MANNYAAAHSGVSRPLLAHHVPPWRSVIKGKHTAKNFPIETPGANDAKSRSPTGCSACRAGQIVVAEEHTAKGAVRHLTEKRTLGRRSRQDCWTKLASPRRFELCTSEGDVLRWEHLAAA
jgi:hypothetical protein